VFLMTPTCQLRRYPRQPLHADPFHTALVGFRALGFLNGVEKITAFGAFP